MKKFQQLAQKLSNSATKSGSGPRMHPHVWQIALHEGLAILAQLVLETTSAGFSCQVLILDDKPEWIVQYPPAV